MAEAVAEVLAVAGLVDHLAGGGVDVFALLAGADRLERRLLGGEHGLVDAPAFLARIAGRVGAGAIGAVAVDLGAHVEDDQLAFGDDPVAGLGVGLGAVRAGGDDRVEGEDPAAGADVSLEGVGDGALGPADEPFFERRLQRRVGELRGLGDQCQLPLVLDPPQPLDRAARGDRLGALAEFLLQFGERPDRDVVVLEADLAGEALGDAAEPIAGQGHAVPLGDLGGGALGVAEVGEEDPHAGAADRRSVGAGEAGQVTDVDQVGDQHLVELAVAEGGLEAIAAAAHQAATPSSWASTPSASR